MYRALNKRATDWLKWISGKHYKHGFQFGSPKLSWERCFTLLFNYAGLYKERSTKEATVKSWNTKKISFQFHYNQFSWQKYSACCYYYRCGTRGKKEEISPTLSRKLEKSSMILWKSALIMVIYWFNISFKMHFLSFSKKKNPRFFPAEPVFLVL